MRATVRYMRGSPQKVRLVVDLIRGKGVEEARDLLRDCRKTAAKGVEKVLLSALANAQKNVPSEGEAPDPDRLYVREAYVGDGPRLKRIRPQPMGRAFRIMKRTCHVTVELGERPEGASRKGK
jgi:large subunit ribosomal protein L22